MSKFRSIYNISKYHMALSPNITHVNFLLTRECNSRCSFCNIWKHPEPGESFSKIKDVFSNDWLKNLRWIQLTGGEPFLHPDIINISNFFYNHFNDPIIWIPTNGIATKNIVDSVRSMDHVNITVSIDGEPDTHNRLRGGVFYDKAVDTIKQVSRLGVKTSIGFTISKDNYMEIVNVYDLAKSLDVGFSCRPVNYSPVYYNNSKLNNNKDGMIRFLSDFFDVVGLNDKYHRIILSYLKNPSESKIPCTALKNSIHVSHNLDAYPCLFMDNKLGSLSNDLLDSLVGLGSIFLRERIKNGRCPNCCVECETCRNLTFHPLRGVSI